MADDSTKVSGALATSSQLPSFGGFNAIACPARAQIKDKRISIFVVTAAPLSTVCVCCPHSHDQAHHHEQHGRRAQLAHHQMPRREEWAPLSCALAHCRHVCAIPSLIGSHGRTGTVVPEAEQNEAFLETLDKFQNSMSDAYVAINDSVELYKFIPCLPPATRPSSLILCVAHGTTGTHAENPGVMEQLKALLDSWCKQIKQGLAEREQMRKQADDVGPRAEFEHLEAPHGQVQRSA
jgi:hypothetical protein